MPVIVAASPAAVTGCAGVPSLAAAPVAAAAAAAAASVEEPCAAAVGHEPWQKPAAGSPVVRLDRS